MVPKLADFCLGALESDLLPRSAENGDIFVHTIDHLLEASQCILAVLQTAGYILPMGTDVTGYGFRHAIKGRSHGIENSDEGVDVFEHAAQGVVYRADIVVELFQLCADFDACSEQGDDPGGN